MVRTDDDILDRVEAETDEDGATEGYVSGGGGGDEAFTATAVSETYKVLGEIDAADAAGVRGHATLSGTAAETFGVEGISDADGDSSTSPDSKTAGVYGKATGSSVVHGLFGEANAPSGQGVVGRNGTGDYGFNEGYPSGVRGITDRSGSDSGVTFATGVAGACLAGSGRGYGVSGLTVTPDGAGVRGITAKPDGLGVLSGGDSKTEGNHETTGYQTVGKIGASVYLSSPQTVPDSTTTTVTFGSVVADDRNEWDANGEYAFVCDTDGEYHVSTTIRWRSKGFAGETFLDLAIAVNGTQKARRVKEIPSGVSDSGIVSQHVCKTLRNLTAGDAITVEVRQTTGGDESLKAGEANTYLDVHKVG